MNNTVHSIMESWPCCNLAALSITGLAEREREFFISFMPEAVTAIVLAVAVFFGASAIRDMLSPAGEPSPVSEAGQEGSESPADTGEQGGSVHR